MKIKIEVDLDDLVNDAISDFDGSHNSFSIKESVVSTIRHECVREVMIKVKDQINIHIKVAIEEEIDNTVKARIEGYIKSFIDVGVINPGTPSEAKIVDLIRRRFDNGDWSQVGKHIDQMCKVHAAELSKQYDMMFATKIVMNLKDSGMLEQGKLQQLLGS